MIQDLKNLDEIYGETSRHSLMGNCGYQLVLGANDQVTAEAVSKGLGKRTVRYKTESRTIELMGLHRRTKVEQLRERDLMMPQEVRQMPGDKMIILAEGQGPIFADKLRFFRTMPFREMERFSQAHLPDVPSTEFLPQRPVPATMPGYAADEAGERSAGAKEAEPNRKAAPSAEKQPVTPDTKRESPLPDNETASPQASRPTSTAPHALDAGFVRAARRLKRLANASPKPGSRRGRSSNWGRIFDETIPDELEIAEAEGR